MSKPNIGVPGALAAIAGIFTLGGLVSVGLLRKALGTILIMLVGIYAISNLKGDFFDMIKNYNARSEAADIRRLEFERERMKLEAETKLKVLEMETKRTESERRAKEQERIRSERQANQEKARAEQERIRSEQQAAAALKKEAEDKVTQAKQAFVNGGFKIFDKTAFRETQYKLLPTKWVTDHKFVGGAKMAIDHKVITAETILSRNELTTATNGMKWQSERLSFEVNCGDNLVRTLSSVVYNGPWGTGDVVRSFNNSQWADLKDTDWRKNFADKFCQT